MPSSTPDSPTGHDPRTHGSSRRTRRWLVPTLIAVVMAVLIAGVLWSRHSGAQDEGGVARTDQGATSQQGPSDPAAPDLTSEEARDPDDLLAEGPADAPVTLVVFTDYQCPFCARWSHDTLPAMREYVDRDELRIEWRDVNIYGENSERATRAAIAAAMQGKHEEYQQALFADGKIRSENELSKPALVRLAGELGLDTGRFEKDMESEKVTAIVRKNEQQGSRLGATSTPAFILGGKPIVGAQPTSTFTSAMDDALAEAED